MKFLCKYNHCQKTKSELAFHIFIFYNDKLMRQVVRDNLYQQFGYKLSISTVVCPLYILRDKWRNNGKYEGQNVFPNRE